MKMIRIVIEQYESSLDERNYERETGKIEVLRSSGTDIPEIRQLLLELAGTVLRKDVSQ